MAPNYTTCPVKLEIELNLFDFMCILRMARAKPRRRRRIRKERSRHERSEGPPANPGRPTGEHPRRNRGQPTSSDAVSWTFRQGEPGRVRREALPPRGGVSPWRPPPLARSTASPHKEGTVEFFDRDVQSAEELIPMARPDRSGLFGSATIDLLTSPAPSRPNGVDAGAVVAGVSAPASRGMPLGASIRLRSRADSCGDPRSSRKAAKGESERRP
jgi:hypothetical protein